MLSRISLIGADELAQMMKAQNKEFVIIDTRGEELFQKACIPGAIHLAWEEWCAKPPAGLKEELNEPGYWGLLTTLDDAALSVRLSSLGFSNDKTLVIYADGKKSKGREGRIAWMLLYFGAQDVRILNGGFQAWKQRISARNLGSTSSTEQALRSQAEGTAAPDLDLSAGSCVAGSAGIAEKSTGSQLVANNTFTVTRDESRRVLLDRLKELMAQEPFPLLIDTRSREEFIGDSYEYMPRTGTLPHAHLLPYADLFNEDGTFIDWEKFQLLLPSNLTNRKETIAFCEVGVRACTVALLYEVYSGKKIPVYDGSIMEWGADPNLPMSRQLKK